MRNILKKYKEMADAKKMQESESIDGNDEDDSISVASCSGENVSSQQHNGDQKGIGKPEVKYQDRGDEEEKISWKVEVKVR